MILLVNEEPDEVRPHFCELLALAFQHVQVCLMMVATEILSHWLSRNKHEQTRPIFEIQAMLTYIPTLSICPHYTSVPTPDEESTRRL